jgi:RNA polymerase sigma factor (sigma-70 family)
VSDGGRPPLGSVSAAAPASDEGEFAALYREYFPALCAFLRRKFGAGPPEPEDAAQAAFTQYANLADRSDIANPRAFLYRCAHNYVLDQRRRQAVSARAAADVVTLNFGLAPAGDDPARVLEGRDALASVAAAIDALDARRRDVLILHSVHELSCAEIARRMKLSPTRVIQLYAQAVAACARALREGGGETSA